MKIYLLFLLGAGHLTVYSQSTGQDDPVKIDGKKVISKDGVFETNLFDLEYVGQLKGNHKRPFLILIGRPCDSCELNNSIYVHSPSDGPLLEGKKQKRYNLPGPINDYQTMEMIYVARLFWGEIIPGRFGLIWFQKEMRKNEWVESVFIAELVNDRIADGLTKADLKVTLDQLKKGKAWEIIGEPITSEPVK